ncbi:MAG: PEP-CTERM sorting domain-containing protein [Acidobacteriota bacterium]|nr:PEP-CTERM sorting domain-containing protein [Acidobacteriota bacterium]
MKKNHLKRLACSLIALSTLCSNSVTQATVVYQNTTGDLVTFLNSGLAEVGDEIVLAPGGRTLTNFTFQYSLTASSGNETVRLRFYNNNGPAFNGFASPGTNFFDSGAFNISGFGVGAHTLIYDSDFGAGLTLPDRFTWSVQFAGIGVGETAGPDLFNPVTVGTNLNDYWDNGTNGWTLRSNPDPINNPINFAAIAQVVPEPSTVALGMIGCVTLWTLRRRNRR